MKLCELFRKNMKIRRLEMGMTQQKLADEAELSYTYISQLERGEKDPSVKTLEKVARALKTRPEFLISEGEDETVLIKKLVSEVQGKDTKKIKLAFKVVKFVMEEMAKYGSEK